MSRFVRFGLGLGLALGLAGPAQAGPADRPPRAGFFAPAEERADADALLTTWLAEIAVEPGGVEAEIALRRLSELMDALPDYHARVSAALASLLQRRDLPGLALDLVRAHLARAALARGDHAAWGELQRGRDLVRELLAIGPFGHSRTAGHERVFPVEADLAGQEPDAGRVYLDRGRRAEFRVLPIEGYPETVDPADYLGGVPGCYYVVVQAQAAEAGPRAIHLRAAAAFKVWLNGALAYDCDSFAQPRPTEVFLEAPLRAGWNRIVVKLSQAGRTGFALRLLGPDLRPDPSLTRERGRVLHPVPPQDQVEIGERASRGAFLEFSRRIQGEREPDAYDLMTYARLLDGFGVEPQAVELARAAQRLRPQDPLLAWQLGLVLVGAEYLPVALRRAQAQEAFEQALKRRGDLVAARLALARLLAEQDRTEESLALLEAGWVPLRTQREAGGAAPDLRLAAARIAEARGWETEALRYHRQALRERPQMPASVAALARWKDARGDAAGAERLRDPLYQADQGRSDLGWALARARLRRGDARGAVARAREVLRARPDDSEGTLELARLLDEAGEAEAAAAERQRTARIWPATPLEPDPQPVPDPEPDDALDLYRRWLAADADADADAGRPLPFACAKGPIRLLDDRRVTYLADGSFREWRHRVHAIADAEGLRGLLPLTPEGELLELRAFLSDGQVRELSLRRGEGGALAIPELPPRSGLEWRTVRRGRWADVFEHLPEPFYFQDPSGQEAIRRARLELAFPGDTPPRLEDRAGIAPERSAEGGAVRLVWLRQDLPRNEPEPMMPWPPEAIAWVRWGWPRTWAEIAERCRDEYADAYRGTPELVLAAREAVKELKAPEERAVALLRLVRARVRPAPQPREATAALLEGQGDRTAVLLGLLRAAEVPHQLARARAAPPLAVEGVGDFPSAEAFPRLLVRVATEEGPPLWLDPVGRDLPPGRLSRELHGGTALTLLSAGPVSELLPWEPLEFHGQRNVMHMRLQADGTLQGALRILHAGEEGYAFKQQLRTAGREQRRAWADRYLQGIFPGAQLGELEAIALDEPAAPLVLDLSVRLEGLARKEGRRRMLPVPLARLGLARPFDGEKPRRQAVVLGRELLDRDQSVVELTPALRWGPIPEPVQLITSHGAYSLVLELDEGQLRVTRSLVVRPQRIPLEEVPAFAEFCRQVDAAERLEIPVELR